MVITPLRLSTQGVAIVTNKFPQRIRRPAANRPSTISPRTSERGGAADDAFKTEMWPRLGVRFEAHSRPGCPPTVHELRVVFMGPFSEYDRGCREAIKALAGLYPRSVSFVHGEGARVFAQQRLAEEAVLSQGVQPTVVLVRPVDQAPLPDVLDMQDKVRTDGAGSPEYWISVYSPPDAKVTEGPSVPVNGGDACDACVIFRTP